MRETATHQDTLPQSHQRDLPDPLMARQQFPYRRSFFPLGFELEIETNSSEILSAAAESWRDQLPLPSPRTLASPLRCRLGEAPSAPTHCPPATSVRAHGHLLSIIADAENFAVCDLHQGLAFGWVTPACVRHKDYLRYHFLEAIALCLLSGSHVSPVHAACVSRNGVGLLLCGESGAGKSTLAYACARAGWTYTSDDACYLLWNQSRPTVRGNAHQLRFRPSARDLFPELAHRSLTPRTEGKPSIEVRTAELPHVAIAAERAIDAIIFLRRNPLAPPNLRPDLRPVLRTILRVQVEPYFTSSCFPLQGLAELQAAALDGLLALPVYELRYREPDNAIACLADLTAACSRNASDKAMTISRHRVDTIRDPLRHID